MAESGVKSQGDLKNDVTVKVEMLDEEGEQTKYVHFGPARELDWPPRRIRALVRKLAGGATATLPVHIRYLGEECAAVLQFADSADADRLLTSSGGTVSVARPETPEVETQVTFSPFWPATSLA